MHRKKLTAEQKIQMVKLYFEEEASKTEIAERYGVDHASVRDYILKYEVQVEYSGVRWAPSPDKLSHHSVLD